MENEKRNDEDTEESRRSFMKKGAITAGGLALGAASADTATAQNRRQVLLYSYEYHPGVQFRVIAPLQQSTTVRTLRLPGGGNVPEISQPDDYSGYVITYTLGGAARRGLRSSAGITTFVFTRQALRVGQRYRTGINATVFSAQLNLLSTDAIPVGGGQ